LQNHRSGTELIDHGWGGSGGAEIGANARRCCHLPTQIWLSTPSGELLAAAVTALTPPPFQQDIDLLIAAALQLAAQRQQAEARQKIAVGLLGGAALAIALGSSRPQLGR
jgi:hypothetical protein